MDLIADAALLRTGPKCESAYVQMHPSGNRSDREAALRIGLSTAQSTGIPADVRFAARIYARHRLQDCCVAKADPSVMLRAGSAPTARADLCAAQGHRFALGDGPAPPNLHRTADDSCV